MADPGSIGLSIAIAVAASAAITGIRLLLAKDPPTQFGPTLGDYKIMAATYGQPRPIVYGERRVNLTNVIWAQEIVQHQNVQEQDLKGGKSATSVFYTYTCSFAVALCEGPVAAVLRVYADGKLIAKFDRTSGAAVGGKYRGNTRYYLGTATQEPDSLIQADEGVANVPAFRGTVYLVFEDLPLGDFGNRIPQITATVTTNAADAFPTETIDPSNTIIMDEAIVTQDQSRIITWTGTGPYDIVVFDIASRSIAGEYEIANIGGFSVSDIPAVDAYGRWYFSNQLTVSTAGLIRQFDGTTFQETGQTGWSSGSSAAIPFAPRSIIAVSLVSGEQRIFAWSNIGTGSEVVVVDTEADPNTLTVAGLLPTMPVIALHDVRDYFAGTWFLKEATIDAQGFVWMVACDNVASGDVALVKLNPASGTPMELYDLGAIGPPSSFNLGLGYDSRNNALLIWLDTANEIVSWSIDNEAVNWTLSSVGLDAGALASFRQGPQGGAYLYVSKDLDEVHEINVDDGTINRTFDLTDWSMGNGRGVLYDPLNHALWRAETLTGDDDMWVIYLDAKTSNKVTLRSIVEDQSTRCGLTVGTHTDFTAFTQLVRGAAMEQRGQARTFIAGLMDPYFTNIVESDHKLKGVNRGGADADTIAAAELGVSINRTDTQSPLLAETRIKETDMPLRGQITYTDRSQDHQDGHQHYQRTKEPIDSERKLLIDLRAITFDDGDEPSQIIETMVDEAWAGDRTYEARLDLEHSRLDPADGVTITDDDGDTHAVMLTQVALGANSVVRARGISRDATVYGASTRTGQGAEGFLGSVINPLPATAFYLVDLPLATDEYDGLVTVVFGGSFSDDDNWPGAALVRSADGTSFDDLFVALPKAANAIHGVTTTVLADGDTHGFDRTNTVTVRMFRGAANFANATELQLLDSVTNGLLIGDEWLQFGTVVDNGDGTLTLSLLRRGRRMTEWATSTHAIGDRVIMPTRATLQAVSIPQADLRVKKLFRGGTVGAPIQNFGLYSMTSIGRSKMPYAPADIAGTVAAGDWTITAVRRTRIGGISRSFSHVAIGEDIVEFEMDVLNGPGGTVVRTITGTASANGSVMTNDADAPSALYDSADQIADFGAEQAELHVVWYQKSDLPVGSDGSGRGFPSVATLSTLGAVVFFDTFTTASNVKLSSHTPNIGTSWTEQELTGTHFLRANATGYAIVSGSEDSDRSSFTANPSPASADYLVKATIDFTDTQAAADDPVFLGLRNTDASNYYAVEVQLASATTVTLTLYKEVAGTPTVLDTDTITLDVTTPFVLQIEAKGTALAVKVDSVQRLSATDSSHASAGNPMLSIGNMRTATDDKRTAWRVDNYTVQLLS